MSQEKWSEQELKDFGKNHGLSPREHQVLYLLTTSVVTFKDMAERLSLSPNTVHNHFRNIFVKTGATSKADLLAKVLKHMVTKYNSYKSLIRVPQIVIVDDNEDLCKVLTSHLESKGMKVYSFCNSRKVMPFLKSFRPDLVITELQMPELDGMSLLKQIRSSYGSSPGVILMSGLEFDGPADQTAIENGALDLISKPLDLEQISSAIMDYFIKDVHEKNRYLRITHEISVQLGEFQDARITNIGYGGVFVVLQNTDILSKGMRFPLVFNLDEEVIHVTGEVVWKKSPSSDEARPGVGMKFTEISTADREKILQYIQLKKALSFIPAESATMD